MSGVCVYTRDNPSSQNDKYNFEIPEYFKKILQQPILNHKPPNSKSKLKESFPFFHVPDLVIRTILRYNVPVAGKTTLVADTGI